MFSFAETHPFCYSVLDRVSCDKQHEKCMRWLAMWLDYKMLENEYGCVIWDIDGTLIDEHTDKILLSSKHVFCDNEHRNIRNFILTARPETSVNRTLTEKMLRENGFLYYEKLIMMPEHLTPSEEAVSTFKERERRKISKKCEVLAYVGDHLTDGWSFPTKEYCLRKRRDDEGAVGFLPDQQGAFVKLARQRG